ncbi:hypothetical protein BJA5080_07262 [Bradyrhizobium diazoefficiens SEMIA 5080]|uniref:Uncharacterized protein n=1 Tax=Bradyrhizobium diazoefficiens SEMIA 5080 TaxID=754504 RepID=A0A837C5Y7_9BRAD|nr:hypothetical protein BJA5080_07262 [Bradyrhizobium diazoefficiens SEMIA 5080]
MGHWEASPFSWSRALSQTVIPAQRRSRCRWRREISGANCAAGRASKDERPGRWPFILRGSLHGAEHRTARTSG